ncbi:MAG: hypothetical protein H7A25_10875 [Leptospiraceae bacterium]|nr:hypothetical protein [Leptospiraceae bacterium]MCP5500398.1 hypothetical protein [Leptospiraceae bacterium]
MIRYLLFIYLCFSILTQLSAEPYSPNFLKTPFAFQYMGESLRPKNLFSIQYYQEEEKNMKLRRSMLDWHQVLGFTTWGLWLATNIAGEQAMNNLENTATKPATLFLLQNPSENLPLYLYLKNKGEWEASGGGVHKGLAGVTFAFYGLTAAMSLSSPSRLNDKVEGGFDSIFAHKLLAVLHFAAMASMPYLGKQIEEKGPDAARRMQQSAWAGFGALSMAFFVFYF